MVRGSEAEGGRWRCRDRFSARKRGVEGSEGSEGSEGEEEGKAWHWHGFLFLTWNPGAKEEGEQ